MSSEKQAPPRCSFCGRFLKKTQLYFALGYDPTYQCSNEDCWPDEEWEYR